MSGFQADSVPSKKLWPLNHLQDSTRNPHLPLYSLSIIILKRFLQQSKTNKTFDVDSVYAAKKSFLMT